MELTPALEDYLETVYELVRDNKVARVRDIARARDVRAGSVTPAMKRLAELGLVEYTQREYITLTPDGEAEARRIYARHQLLTRFFAEVLSLPLDEARENACSMEHSLSDQAMDGLARFFEFLHACPVHSSRFLETFHHCALVHGGEATCGRACQSKSERRRRATTAALSELRAGDHGTVTQVDGQGPIRQRLLDMGLLPGVELTVERVGPAGGPVWVRLQGFQLALRRKEADAVRVAMGAAD